MYLYQIWSLTVSPPRVIFWKLKFYFRLEDSWTVHDLSDETFTEPVGPPWSGQVHIFERCRVGGARKESKVRGEG